MKERIIIEQDWLVKDMKSGMPEPDKLVVCQKIEQVPETWEELKELCKVLDGCKIEEDYIEIIGCLVGSNILFCKDGAIMLNTDCCFVEKASYDRMWQIIKNLIC